eukprot:16452348-Heterocapsa_arctica.AAC.3
MIQDLGECGRVAAFGFGLYDAGRGGHYFCDYTWSTSPCGQPPPLLSLPPPSGREAVGYSRLCCLCLRLAVERPSATAAASTTKM